MIKVASSFEIARPPDRVYAALVDPAVLQRCIPGCEELRAIGPDTYEARLKIGVAGINGRYTGKAVLRDQRPPESFTIVFDGKGTPGFVRGTATVRLAPDPAGTRVTSAAEVQVGGLIASVASRLVDATARKLADDFFRKLAAEIGA